MRGIKGSRTVEITDKDMLLFNFIYKHNFSNFKSIKTIYGGKDDTIKKRIRKLEEYDYLKKRNIRNMETIYTFGKELIKKIRRGDVLYYKTTGQTTSDKIAKGKNVNHHLIICEIGAELTKRNINYEIDDNIARLHRDWPIKPDIMFNNKIGLEIELEYKKSLDYAKKLSRLQVNKNIDILVYLVEGRPETLQRKMSAIERYEAGKTFEEKIIRSKTKERIKYARLNEFVKNIDEYLSKFNLLSRRRTDEK